MTRAYAFGPSVRLQVTGAARAREHFDREYAPAVASEHADVEADVGFTLRPSGEARGGHKSARWSVALGDPGEQPLRARIALAGGPPSFALSLVQGYYVEPLVSVALARAGFAALPSAAVVGGRGALVIMGRSRSGKSSVSVRQLAAGRALLGDDQVVIGARGACWTYPRRLRVYPDIRDTAPDAWPKLRAHTRRTLRGRAALRRATRGAVAPSLAVATSELGPAPPRERVPLAGVLVVERAAGGSMRETDCDAAWAVAQARELLAAQRARLAAVADGRWRAALRDTVDREEAVLAAWLDGTPVTHLTIPDGLDAPTAVGALAERVASRLG